MCCSIAYSLRNLCSLRFLGTTQHTQPSTEQDSKLSSIISEVVARAATMSGYFAIWIHQSTGVLRAGCHGASQRDLISWRPVRSRSLNEICLTKASANITMVQFFFWKLTQLTDQLHSTGEIKGYGEGREFPNSKSQTKISSQKDTQQAGRRAK